MSTARKLPLPHPDVIFGTLNDGAVLYATGSEVYFGLNPAGASVWELLPPARETLDELCAELERRFPDATGPVIRQDVEELLSQLEENGLVLPRGADDEAADDGGAVGS